MTTTVVAYFPSPPQGVWHLGPVPIRAYALFIIIGIVAALLIGDRRWEARGGERGVIYDIALWAVPFGLIGGRLYHLATDWRTYFGAGGAGLGAALRIWDGGLGIWGAVALGGVGAWIACRRRGIPLPAFGDAIAPGIVLAQAIGRLGNYFNQELFGRETTMPWGLEIFYRRDPAGFVDVHSLDGVSTGQLAMVVQPTFLYELLWNLLVFALLIYLDRRFTIGHGRLFAVYVAGYCIGRFCIELLRDDAATHIAGIRINSFTATFVFIGAVVYLILAPKGREDPAALSGSAADRLAPDSVEADTTDSVESAVSDAVADEPVEEPETAETTAPETAETTAPETAETTAPETAAADKPDIEAETVAAEADAAEVDAPEVEVAGTPEPEEEAAADQPEGEAAEAEEPAEAPELHEAEEPAEAPELHEAEEPAEAPELHEAGEGEPEPELHEAGEGEPEPELHEATEGEPEPELHEAAEAEEPAEAPELHEATEGEPEPELHEATEGEPEPELHEAGEGEPEPEAADGEADESEAESRVESGESPDHEPAVPVEPIPGPTDATATQSGWLQRLNSRLRRR
jgi:prolipoprotein diacylglyceryl transferase